MVQLHAAITDRSPAGWEAEESCSWATDASVLRAYARQQADAAVPASEVIKVERHLRKLARAMAVTRTAVMVRDADGSTRVIRMVKNRVDEAGNVTGAVSMVVKRGYRHVDQSTGEITWKTRHQRGQYGGGSGYLIVNDGRVTAASIAKLLGAAPPPDPHWRDRRGDYALIG